jgi:hypothetical protein
VLSVTLCDAFYCIELYILYCTVLLCSTLLPGISPIAVNNNNILISIYHRTLKYVDLDGHDPTRLLCRTAWVQRTRSIFCVGFARVHNFKKCHNRH